MSSNISLFLDANYKNWLDKRGSGLGSNQFVHYCAELFLKPHDPTDEDITYGITDGANDGGVDAIYFIIERNEFIRDDTDLGERKPTRARLIIMQMKSGDGGFKMTEVDKMESFADDLLDLSKNATWPELAAKYHPHLLEIMQTFKDKKLITAATGLDFSVDFFYITQADGLEPDKKAIVSANRVKATVVKHFNKAKCEYHFINAGRLYDQVSARVSKDYMLTWAEQPMRASDGMVGLVELKDFYHFLRDENGELMERLFESNVRGYQRKTAVKNIVSMMELTKALVAIAIQRPDDARARAGNYMKDDQKYKELFGRWKKDGVFSGAFPLGLYLNCVKIVREVEAFLESPEADSCSKGHELNIKFYLAMYATCAALGKCVPSKAKLADFKIEMLTSALLKDCQRRVWKAYEKLSAYDAVAHGTVAYDTVAKGSELLEKLTAQIKNRFKP